jgi:hypothetical protein
MDLTGRLDPELAAVFPDLPALDLTDIPTVRTAMMDMLAAANAGAATAGRPWRGPSGSDRDARP